VWTNVELMAGGAIFRRFPEPCGHFIAQAQIRSLAPLT
jgi:hypothetical protein